MSQRGMQPQQRLRASCDACSSSKVKCDKEHPSCRRCLSSGIACVYGISRKHGQQPHRKQRTIDHSQQPLHKSNSIPAVFDSQNSIFASSWNLSFDELLQDLEFPFDASNGALESQDLFQYGNEHVQTQGQNSRNEKTSSSANERLVSVHRPPSAISDEDGNEDRLEQFPRNDIMPSPPWTSNPSHLGFTQGVASSIPSAGGNSIQTTPASVGNQQHSCYNQATMILDHLRLEDRFACASHQSTDSSQTCQQLPTLTFDHILAANKTAMSIARQVISCRCAAKDPHLTFLHASVFSKIIFWYRVASRIISAAAVNIPDDLNKQTAPSHDDSLNNMDEHLNGASQIGNQSSSDGHFSLNPVTVLPFTIGAFELESVDRAILSCELLLSELRKVGRLLEVFQAGQADWRNEVSTEGPQVSAPAAGEGPMGGLHAMLGKWLKRELQKTFESIHHQRMTRLST